MASIAIGIDNIYGYNQDLALLNECASILEKAGHTVHKCGVGPSVTQQYMNSHTADWMVQIAGGLCIGSLSDFCYGIKQGYYHAKKACIPLMYKHFTSLDPYTYVPTGGAWDDNFSHGLPSSWFSQFLNMTFPEVYKKWSQYLLPYSPGKTAQEMMDKMLNGNTTGDLNLSGGNGGGQTARDLIMQVITPWDKYGVTVDLWDNKVYIRRAKTKNAPIINEKVVVNDSITITDYDENTPNIADVGNYNIQNDTLIDRFGKVPCSDIENKGRNWVQDMYQVAQRDSGHTIDLKILYAGAISENMYVLLDLPSVGIKGYYFITKLSYDDGVTVSLTLEPAPPHRQQEQTGSVDINVSNTGSGGDMISIGNNLASKYTFCSKVARDGNAKGYITSTYSEMKQSGCGDCHAWSDALYTELNAAGIKTRIIQYSTSMAGNHRSVQVFKNGSWEDYPYRDTNISKYARNTTSKSGMYVWKDAP